MSGHTIPRDLARDRRAHYFTLPTIELGARESLTSRIKDYAKVVALLFLVGCMTYGVMHAIDLLVLAFSK